MVLRAQSNCQRACRGVDSPRDGKGLRAEEDGPMMTQRQAAFRSDYRTRISPWYSGLGHVLVIAALGLATIWYCARNLNQPTLFEWLVVPAALIASNLFEWAMHRFIMHRPVRGLMGLYKRHTLQ